jgi:hypothetical protein
MSFSHYLGVDLGQARDPTAVCVLEEPLWATADWAERLFLPASGWVSVVGLGADQVDRLRAFGYHQGRPHEPPLRVRHLERLPLGTSYPDVVAHIKSLMGRPELPADSTALVVDATGCGRPVIDMMRLAGLRPVAVTITAGTATTYDLEDGSCRVPKRDLISVVAVLLEQRRLEIAEALPEAATLKRELGTFRRRVTRDGDDTYSSWREADHDDLVLSVALAAWYRQWFNVHLDLANSAQERTA